jgi:acetyl-CoA C-acetyltransferase
MTGTDTFDPRTPVLIGAGQFSNRTDQGATPLEPADLMVEALRRAEADTGVAGAVAGADSVRVLLELSWRYADPGAIVAERLGASPRESIYTVMGGNYVQTLVNRTALDILEGRNDLVLLTGGEAWRTRSSARKAEIELDWTKQDDGTTPALPFGEDHDLMGPGEVARGIFLPVQLYPMFDNALRAADGISIEAHRRRVADLWARFSEVAATNPHAWTQQAFTSDELMTATPDNRMVGFPYTKRMNSNNNVDQGAGLILCSAARAEALGVDRDRWVFLHAGADATDHWFVSNRDDLHSSPAIRFAGRAALDAAGVAPADLAHVDLYSCFPSAVQVAARELGLGTERQLTVTGGMSFAGGPWNNYTMHGIATMSGVLRDDPGAVGLCTANGGYLTKHAFGVYGTEPPPAGAYRWVDAQAEVDATPSRELDAEPDGTAEIETYTVMHERDGEPEKGLAALRMPDGRRAWGVTTDADTMRAMTTDEFIGRKVSVVPDGTITVD